MGRIPSEIEGILVMPVVGVLENVGKQEKVHSVPCAFAKIYDALFLASLPF